MTTAPTLHPSELADRLAPHVGELARILTGTEPTSRSGTEWRFRAKGSLSVIVAGPKRGGFYDHEAGTGGDALSLVAHLRGHGLIDACQWGATFLGLPVPSGSPWRPRSAPVEVRPAPLPAAAPDPGKLALAQRLWCEAREARGTPAERYLMRRGLELPEDAPARFLPSCPRGKTERLPALLWLLTDPLTNEPVGVQRVFLTDQGDKAPGVARMVLGSAGIIRLVPDLDVTTALGIAEGAETALAVMQRYGWRPVWAALSAGGIAAFPILPGVEALTIWADQDEPGLKAAQACTERWTEAGRSVTTVLPPAGDFNDLIRGAA